MSYRDSLRVLDIRIREARADRVASAERILRMAGGGNPDSPMHAEYMAEYKKIGRLDTALSELLSVFYDLATIELQFRPDPNADGGTQS